jgi:hypothetical protein
VQEFSLLHNVQTDTGAHPASYPMGTGGSFPGGKFNLKKYAENKDTLAYVANCISYTFTVLLSVCKAQINVRRRM